MDTNIEVNHENHERHEKIQNHEWTLMDTSLEVNHERHGKVRVGVARRPARTSNGRWEGRVVGGIVFPPTTRSYIRTFRRFSSKRRISHQSHSGMAVG